MKKRSDKLSRRAFGSSLLLPSAALLLPPSAYAGLIGISGARGAVQTPEIFDFYIGLGGNSAGPGSLASPWALDALNTRRSDYQSKKVGLLDGTYGLITIFGQLSFGGGTADAYVLGIAAGSGPSARTVIKSVNPRGAIIDWQRASRTQTQSQTMGMSIAPLGDYVTIDGLTFKDNEYTAIGQNRNGSPGGSHQIIKNCWFKGQQFTQTQAWGQNAATIYSEGYNDITISNCRFQDGGMTDGSGGNRFSFIQTYDTTDGVVIEDCTFIWPSASVYFAQSIYGKQANNKNFTIRRCFSDASGNSLSGTVSNHPSHIDFNGSADTSAYLRIYNNVFVNNSSAGQHTLRIGSEGNGQAGPIEFYYNTALGPCGNGSGSPFYEMDRGLPIQTSIYRNVLHRVSGATPEHGDYETYQLSKIGQSDYNLFSTATPRFYYNSDGSGNVGSHQDGLAAWRTASGFDMNSAIGTPLFVAGIEALGYQLTGPSPGKTLGPGATEVGAWGGAPVSIGASFGP